MRGRGLGMVRAGLALVAAILSAGPAAAYVTLTADQGKVVKWPGSCVYYSIYKAGAPGIPFDDLDGAIRASFDPWTQLPCTYMEAKETAPASCVQIGFNDKGGNMNLLVWQHEKWPHDDPNAMALTTVSYDHKTGEILDADIEFNAYYFVFGLDGTIGKADVRNTATHEIGHVFGLDHAPDPKSTMYGIAMPGETNKRTLSSDDEKGFCFLYPKAEDPGTCEEPYCGLDLDCRAMDCSAASGGSGCAAVRPGGPDGDGVLDLFGMLGRVWL